MFICNEIERSDVFSQRHRHHELSNINVNLGDGFAIKKHIEAFLLYKNKLIILIHISHRN